jgi:RNA polymerase sigma-70 factor (ECF subfamily)
MADLRSPGVLDSPGDLVALALAGDEAAFARIVRLHREAMVRVAYVVTGDLDLARGAVAAAWPVAWNRLGALDDVARLRPWLCSVAADEARAVVRHWSGMDQEVRAGPAAGAETRAAGGDGGPSDPELAVVLQELNVDDRLLLALAHVGGLTPVELGRAAGMTPPTATARCRALDTRLDLRLAADPATPARGGVPVTDRLRTYADVFVPPANIDAVAHVARITRHDRRNHQASVVVAAIVAVVMIALTTMAHMGGSGAWPGIYEAAYPPLPLLRPASPDPSPPAPDGG